MPSYDYKCPICGNIEEIVHSIKESPVIICDKCSGGKEKPMERLISGSPNFIIKGGTPASHWKEKRLRNKNNKDLELRQIDRYGTGPKLQPNVEGQMVESWSDAAKLAKDKGKNAESYNTLIEKEKRTSKLSGVDDLKWKKAKEEKNR